MIPYVGQTVQFFASVESAPKAAIVTMSPETDAERTEVAVIEKDRDNYGQMKLTHMMASPFTDGGLLGQVTPFWKPVPDGTSPTT